MQYFDFQVKLYSILWFEIKFRIEKQFRLEFWFGFKSKIFSIFEQPRVKGCGRKCAGGGTSNIYIAVFSHLWCLSHRFFKNSVYNLTIFISHFNLFPTPPLFHYSSFFSSKLRSNLLKARDKKFGSAEEKKSTGMWHETQQAKIIDRESGSEQKLIDQLISGSKVKKKKIIKKIDLQNTMINVACRGSSMVITGSI